jgi:hypothetical protein
MAVMEHIVRSLTDCSFRADVTILNIMYDDCFDEEFSQNKEGGRRVSDAFNMASFAMGVG